MPDIQPVLIFSPLVSFQSHCEPIFSRRRKKSFPFCSMCWAAVINKIKLNNVCRIDPLGVLSWTDNVSGLLYLSSLLVVWKLRVIPAKDTREQQLVISECVDLVKIKWLPSSILKSNGKGRPSDMKTFAKTA